MPTNDGQHVAAQRPSTVGLGAYGAALPATLPAIHYTSFKQQLQTAASDSASSPVEAMPATTVGGAAFCADVPAILPA
eukprot:12019934-Alexandrium_andersonii.AAC.1